MPAAAPSRLQHTPGRQPRGLDTVNDQAHPVGDAPDAPLIAHLVASFVTRYISPLFHLSYSSRKKKSLLPDSRGFIFYAEARLTYTTREHRVKGDTRLTIWPFLPRRLTLVLLVRSPPPPLRSLGRAAPASSPGDYGTVPRPSPKNPARRRESRGVVYAMSSASAPSPRSSKSSALALPPPPKLSPSFTNCTPSSPAKTPLYCGFVLA